MTWTRRLFVRKSIKGWLGLVLGPAGYGIARAIANKRASEFHGPTDIGATSDLGSGMTKTVQYGSDRVLVFQGKDGLLHAVSAICTHMGCSIRFDAERGDGQLACNCHESRFSFQGERISGPATEPLKEYRVGRLGGRLILAETDSAPNKN